MLNVVCDVLQMRTCDIIGLDWCQDSGGGEMSQASSTLGLVANSEPLLGNRLYIKSNRASPQNYTDRTSLNQSTAHKRLKR